MMIMSLATMMMTKIMMVMMTVIMMMMVAMVMMMVTVIILIIISNSRIQIGYMLASLIKYWNKHADAYNDMAFAHNT
eukprot:5097437-Karenia_brevis.AAC.1